MSAAPEHRSELLDHAESMSWRSSPIAFLSRIGGLPLFSGIVAITAVGALMFARVQIKDNRQALERQLEQSHKEDQIEHLLAMVHEFDQDPMATYRRDLAKKRLAGKPDDPYEIYRELDFFETVDVLVDHGYLNDKDVWDQFRWWIFNLNADPG